MQTWLDLITVTTALIAIWFTIRESRRNQSVILDIKECCAFGRQAVDENGGQFFHEFKLILRNRGISLHHIHASINFRDPDGHGRFNLPLRRRKRTANVDEFAKGMIVEFGFKSYELEKHDLEFLSLLRDPKKQDAMIYIYSQDYLAALFRIGGSRERIKSRWNAFAF